MTVNGTTYSYITQNGQVVKQTGGGHTLEFVYDNQGRPMTLVYDGTAYTYMLNLQGDVIALLDSSGGYAAWYVYDAWGKVLTVSGSNTTLANVNPLRYRGYYYDTETGLYYLQSRYYDPEVKRFVNADYASSVFEDDGFLSKNLFAYCHNRPTVADDQDGQWLNIVIGAAVGGLLSSVGEVVNQVAAGTNLKDIDWKDVAIEGVNGALTGGLISAGLPVSVTTVGRAAINATTSVAHSVHAKDSAGSTITKACMSAAGTIFAGNMSRTKLNISSSVGAVVKTRVTRVAARVGVRVVTRNIKNSIRKKVYYYKARRAILV